MKWSTTVTALLTAFVVQLEPAQWTGITVWTVFIQNPRMNYSKIIWWAFGTIVGAFMAVILTVFFNQMPEVLLLFLALSLAGCRRRNPGHQLPCLRRGSRGLYLRHCYHVRRG